MIVATDQSGTPVSIEIPFDLIDIAICYPETDWNAVMEHAVKAFRKHRDAMAQVSVGEFIAQEADRHAV